MKPPTINRGGGPRPARPPARPAAAAARSNTRVVRSSGAGTALALASPSTLVVRYPAAIDTPPAIAGDQSTPIVGLFHNYLGLLIEAVQAEVGPLDLFQAGQSRDLLYWLGSELTGNRVSNWRSQTKTSGGDAAGQVFGLHKRTVSGASTFYNPTQSTTFSALQGQHPTTKTPVLFATPSAFNHGAGIFTGPAIIRGQVTGFAGGAYPAQFRGANGLFAGGDSSGAGTFQADLLLLYMVEAF